MKPIAAHALAAADARLRAAYLPWFERLSKEEREALADYKGRAGRNMNELLRSDDPELAEFAASTIELRRALRRATAPEDMLVYRGVGSAEADFYRALAQGGCTRVPAFVSTSIALHIASGTAAAQGGVLVELIVRRGRRGVAYVNPFPTYRYPQFEVLVNAGSMLKMLRVRGEGIRLEVVDDDGIE